MADSVVMRGAVLAGVPVTEGWPENPQRALKTGGWVRTDPGRKLVELLRRAP